MYILQIFNYTRKLTNITVHFNLFLLTSIHYTLKLIWHFVVDQTSRQGWSWCWRYCCCCRWWGYTHQRRRRRSLWFRPNGAAFCGEIAPRDDSVLRYRRSQRVLEPHFLFRTTNRTSLGLVEGCLGMHQLKLGQLPSVFGRSLELRGGRCLFLPWRL